MIRHISTRHSGIPTIEDWCAGLLMFAMLIGAVALTVFAVSL